MLKSGNTAIIKAEATIRSLRRASSKLKQSVSILLVEDDQTSSTLTAEILKSAGYKVVTATDGFKAIAACRVRSPELILLSTSLPLLSGRDVLSRLRQEEKTKDIPVILLCQPEETGNLLADDHMDYDFATKPLQPTELLSRIKTALRVKTLKEDIKTKEGQIRELSLVDPVTSLRNSRYLNEFLKAEIAQCRRFSVPLSVVVLVIDRHAELAQLYGQRVADSLVAQVACTLAGQCRQSDLLARLGACEMALVLPHTDRQGAIQVAERVRNHVASFAFTAGNHSVALTVSLGLCQFVPAMDGEGKTLLEHARQALAEATRQGGNVTLMAH